MTQRDIIALLKSSGFSARPGKTSTSIVVDAEKGTDRKSLLKDILPVALKKLNPKYTTTPPIKSSAGGLMVGNICIVSKPVATSGAGNLASLDARIFLTKGKPTKFSYGGEMVDVVEFTSAKLLAESITHGIKTSNLLGPTYAEMLDEYFSSGAFNWPKNAPLDLQSKLAVYAGEVLIGFAVMAKSKAAFLTPTPFSGAAKRFMLPTNPSFSGVDSFIELQSGELIGISSKLDRGAAASIFTNLLPKAILKAGTMPPCVLKTLVTTIQKAGLQPTKSKDVVYEYGVREILGIPARIIKNPSDVYEQIRTGKLGIEAKLAVAAMKDQAKKHNVSATILTSLPNSASAYFNTTIANRLNNDKKSIETITHILQSKNYWQANLDKREWMGGQVRFRLTNSGKASVVIEGKKSAANDITAKQGWVNYVLS